MLLQAENATLSSGGAVAMLADNIAVESGGAQYMLARNSIQVEQGGAVVVAAPRVEITNGGAMFVFAREVHGDMRVMFDRRGALVFGIAAGIIIGLLALGKRR
jgi:hypothetical protein